MKLIVNEESRANSYDLKVSDLSDNFAEGLANCLEGFCEGNGYDYGYSEEGLKELEKQLNQLQLNKLLMLFRFKLEQNYYMENLIQ